MLWFCAGLGIRLVVTGYWEKRENIWFNVSIVKSISFFCGKSSVPDSIPQTKLLHHRRAWLGKCFCPIDSWTQSFPKNPWPLASWQIEMKTIGKRFRRRISGVKGHRSNGKFAFFVRQLCHLCDVDQEMVCGRWEKSNDNEKMKAEGRIEILENMWIGFGQLFKLWGRHEQAIAGQQRLTKQKRVSPAQMYPVGTKNAFFSCHQRRRWLKTLTCVLTSSSSSCVVV